MKQPAHMILRCLCLLAIACCCSLLCLAQDDDSAAQRPGNLTGKERAEADAAKKKAAAEKSFRLLKKDADSLRERSTSLEKEARRHEQVLNNLRRNTMVLGVVSMLLLGFAVYSYFKFRKMSGEHNRKQLLLDKYMSQVGRLENFLVRKNLMSDVVGRREIERLRNDIEELIERYTNEETRNQAVNDELQKMRDHIQEISKDKIELQKRLDENNQAPTHVAPMQASPPPPITPSFIPFVAPVTHTFIKSEIIISAGPRKDTGNSDTELGEDVAGSISLPDQTFFWLLDGTSDMAAVKSLEVSENEDRHEEFHVFSSRLLSQNIGNYIQKNIEKYFNSQMRLEDLMQKSIEHVSTEWEKRINNEPQETKDSVIKMIDKGYKPLCSTTLIIGRLTTNGYLYALRTGDSKVMPFKKLNGSLHIDKDFKFSADPTEEYDRIAFRLDYDKEGNSFSIKKNKPKWLEATSEDVQLVLAFSDGIGRVTEAQLNSNNPGITDMIRQNIGRIRQKTYDDKTLIILERVESGNATGAY
jgi:hypothetical protein